MALINIDTWFGHNGLARGTDKKDAVALTARPAAVREMHVWICEDLVTISAKPGHAIRAARHREAGT